MYQRAAIKCIPVFVSILCINYNLIFAQAFYYVVNGTDTTNYFEYDTICTGTCVQYFANTPFEASFYYWEFDGGLPEISTEPDPVVCYYTNGEFVVNFYIGDEFDIYDTAYSIGHTPLTGITCTPFANFQYQATLCAGTCISFTDSSQFAPASWQWSFEGGEPSASTLQNPENICYTVAGVFPVQQIVCNDAGCDTNVQYITVNNTPEITNPLNQAFYINYTDILSLSACADGDSYTWFENNFLLNEEGEHLQVMPEFPFIVYQCIISNNNGCSDTCSYVVHTDNIPADLEMPNTFTPNNDGLNDIFIIQKKNILLHYFAVYDRWGERIFYTNNLQTGWDGTSKGKTVQNGVYAYIIEYQTQEDSVIKTKSGNITLLR